MEGAPQTQAMLEAADALDAPSPLDLHFFLLQDALDDTVKAGGHLADALDRFNRQAAPEFQLSLDPHLTAQARHAELQPQQRSGALAMAWLDYRLLAVPGALDRLVTHPATTRRLELCRHLGRDVSAREARVAREHQPVPAQRFREWLIAGCAVQLCLEATQLRQRQGQRFDFKVPVHAVIPHMTPLEQSVMTGVVSALHAYLPGMLSSQEALSPPPAHRPDITFVSMDHGDPMGCVVLREDRQADDAAVADSRLHPDLEALIAHLDAEPLQGWDDVDIDVHHNPSEDPSQAPIHDDILDRFHANRLSRELRLEALRQGGALESAVHLRRRAPEPSPLHFDDLQPTASPDWLTSLVLGEHQDAALDASGESLDAALLLDPEIQAIFAPGFDAAVEQLLHDLRVPLRWTDFSADLAPRLLASVPEWPIGRTLDVHQAQTGSLMLRFGVPMADRAPVRVVRSPDGHRYACVQGTRMLYLPNDGDGFFSAVLASLAPHERQTLLDAVGCSQQEAQRLGPSVARLREHLARHLDHHREDYRDSIVLHQFLAG